ncbi:MAG: PIN domain-containing protein [Chitinivibrionales bacterium]|nr:PIN domain-containing protein [Chitinivibrionales bacterium]
MTDIIFTDTSALIALLNKKDQYHPEATAILKAILKKNSSLLITTHIFAETVTRIERRISPKKAVEAGSLIRKNEKIRIVTPDESSIEHAWQIYQKYQDQRFSFVDCISFATMKEMGLSKAFAFDKHFKIMGFDSP